MYLVKISIDYLRQSILMLSKIFLYAFVSLVGLSVATAPFGSVRQITHKPPLVGS